MRRYKLPHGIRNFPAHRGLLAMKLNVGQAILTEVVLESDDLIPARSASEWSGGA